MAEKKLLSQTEYAKYRGVPDMTISKAIASGRISFTMGENNRRLIDPEVADVEWIQNTNMAHVRKKESDIPKEEPDNSGIPEYQKSRRMKEALLVRQLNFEMEVKMGKYVLVEAVERGASKMASIFRDTILGISSRIAPQLCSITDPVEMQAKLDAEHRKALEQVADASWR